MRESDCGRRAHRNATLIWKNAANSAKAHADNRVMNARPLAERDVFRVLTSLLEGELRRGRGNDPLDPPRSAWTDRTPIGAGGLNADSIETVGLAGRVNELFHLYESGTEDNLLKGRTLGDWTDVIVAARRSADARLTFLTSGSKGVPKPCTHRTAELMQEIEQLAMIHSSRRRIVGMVPPHHIYGFLFTVLLPAELGVPVLDAREIAPGALVKELRACDLIVGFPLVWSFLSRSLESLPRDVDGVCSTGACDEEVARRLFDKGLARLSEYYGSTETGGVGVRHLIDQPFVLHPFWTRSAVSGDGAFLTRALPDGSRSDPIAAPDMLEWMTERTFVVRGRRDDAVKVAGINVFPERVASVLISHPAVREASVRLMRPSEGDRLKAYIVPDSPESELDGLRKELEGFIQRWLEPHERPKSIAFGPALPRSPLGKPADW